MRISKELLIAKPENKGRHVVILGAGASVAAFPDGDANSRKLPTMDNIIEVVWLKDHFEQAGVKHKGRISKPFIAKCMRVTLGQSFLKK
ncbi:MAG: hypothetical protein ACLP29_04985 [Dissulfurispiraceae bacterium]